MPVDVAAPIVRHEKLNPDHFLLTLDAAAIARAAKPGQFVMLQTRAGSEPLLRRPMSVCRVLPRRRHIQILYKVVGAGTRYLADQREKVRLRTLGPLGNGFRPPGAGRDPVLVAGGVGIAIFPFLAEELLRKRRRPRLLFGARSRADLVAVDFFRRRRVPVGLATEDGGAGTRGYVTHLLEPLLRRGAPPVELYVCGPTPMLRAVRRLALDAGVACQLALESPMPCGLGVCLGCVTACPPDAVGPLYRRVCTEGPVFDAAMVEP